MKFEEMTVEELKVECRKMGLPLQAAGKKFRKGQLIENLKKKMEEAKSDQKIVKSDPEEEPWDEPPHGLGKEAESAYGQRKAYGTTLEELESRYLYRREPGFYEEKLIVGCVVYFIHYITTKTGKYIKKLRTARVVDIDREKETVYAETIFGTKFALNYDEIMYVRQWDERGMVPKDLHNFLRNQRTLKGKESVYDKFRQVSEGTVN